MNRFLTCLTNRAHNFQWMDLKSPLSPLPDPELGAVDNVRTLLGLKRADTDYFVIGALSTFSSIPDLINWFGPDETTYDLATYSRPPFFMIGAKLLPDRNGLPVFGRLDSVWPARIGSALTRVTDERARWQCGNQFEFCDTRLQPDDHLQVSWPAASGISGRLELDNTWSVLESIEIRDEPINYPFEALLAALPHEDTDEVVRRAGLQEAFYGAVTPLERVATVITSLAALHRDSGIAHA
jgi:hypothetical protein